MGCWLRLSGGLLLGADPPSLDAVRWNGCCRGGTPPPAPSATWGRGVAQVSVDLQGCWLFVARVLRIKELIIHVCHQHCINRRMWGVRVTVLRSVNHRS